MDPQTCTIILLKQTNPFHIQDNEDTTVTLLETIFGHVHKETNLESCLNYVQLLPSSSTLLLLDLDSTSLSEKHVVEMINETVHTMSETVPVTVCSTKDDPNFMLECIQAGASDYLLKPLRPDVIKTLFLTLHRQHSKLTESSLSQEHLVSSSTISTVTSVMSPITPTTAPPHSAYLPDRIGDRIKALNDKDINFTKAILETYIPTSNNTILPACKQLNSEQRLLLEKRVSSWDFSPLNLTHEDLIHCTVIILEQTFSLSEVKEFPQEQLYDFIIDLSNIYHDENPYHNFSHAVDVLQCIYYFLCQMGLLPYADGSPITTIPKPYRILRPTDIFALLIAAIGHDTAHPGVNNSFLINTSAPLALLYNDNSVLESFHAMTLFQLLKKHKFDDVLGGCHSVEYNEFRKLVITSILSTDMALHSDYVIKINEQNQRLEESDPNDWTPARCLEERLLFCSGLIKCADISNVARPFPRAFEWAQILIEEFASQGDLERELGMPVLPMNDRSKIILEDSQIGFIKFVALNLFQSISNYMQELSFPVDYIKSNLSIWEDRKRENIDSITDTTEQSTTTTVIDNRHDDDSTTEEEEDYHTQAVNALNKKDLDDYTLPKMPAVAMTSLSQNNIYPAYKDADAQLQRDYDHGDWDPRESSGPVYCHCTIQ